MHLKLEVIVNFSFFQQLYVLRKSSNIILNKTYKFN